MSQVRQTAEESEARKRAVFESALDCIVTMDSHGNSLHKDVEQESGQQLEAIGV